MPQSSREWYDDVSRRIAERGHQEQDPLSWQTWPWDEDYAVRPLDGPTPEPARQGEGGNECFICDANEDPGDYVVWWDDVAMLGRKREGTPIPFLAFLMPRRHSDLAGLSEAEASRMGILLTHLERAVCEVLDVPRIQAARWGDGTEHLHWWIYGRPTGVLQLRGTFLALWEDLLPVRDQGGERDDIDLVVARLVEIAGGEALPRRPA